MKRNLFIFLSLSVLAVLIGLGISFLGNNAGAKGAIVLTNKNAIVLREAVTGESVSNIMQQMLHLNEKESAGKPLYLVLDTPGGSVVDGAQLIDFANSLGRPVHTISLIAFSMGFQIVQGLGERHVLPTSILMSHRAKGSISGEFGGQSKSQIENRFSFWNQLIEQFDIRTVERTNGKQTLASYQAAYENELWLFGKQAVEQGYADKVSVVRCDNSLSGTKDENVVLFGFKINVTFSACPLISSPITVKVNNLDDSPLISQELHDKIVKEIMFKYSLEGKKQEARLYF
jgi:ATP-dependent protease ClpP protease subunit